MMPIGERDDRHGHRKRKLVQGMEWGSTPQVDGTDKQPQERPLERAYRMTKQEFEGILRTAAGADYAVLSEAEVRQYIGQGLCESNRHALWLGCRFCTNKGGKSLCLETPDQVRRHFQAHQITIKGKVQPEPSTPKAAPSTEAFEQLKAAATAECLGVWANGPPRWARADAAARLDAARSELP